LPQKKAYFITSCCGDILNFQGHSIAWLRSLAARTTNGLRNNCNLEILTVTPTKAKQGGAAEF
jgi:hypothetical protein